jgi:hypothetical protein
LILRTCLRTLLPEMISDNLSTSMGHGFWWILPYV